MEKIYVGKNKKQARLVTLKQLLIMAMEEMIGDKCEIISDTFNDNSASWIEVQKEVGCKDKPNKGHRLDLVFDINPKTNNTLEDIKVYVSEKVVKYDDENMQRIG